ncbi:hypothetical protein CBR_g17692 [Chara braunii]|uniref:Uncharacterized protein n=1 Tax=Chara braunii TaxID=69332 RepID=A0A388KVA8_CHABU|nr:hypothetical protein CBR_g17692 [Chara braunii]|eukprot:GBG73981.1 hypothetical protein CBR_g17692 [Chara braunii]
MRSTAAPPQVYYTYPGGQAPSTASVQPSNVPTPAFQIPQPVLCGAQQWPSFNPWQGNGEWAEPTQVPVSVPGAAPAQAAAPVPAPFLGQHQGGNSHNAHSGQGVGLSTSSGGGKGPAANNFPGFGNRAYFTKEYMEIFEGIKMEKVLDQAKKKMAISRRSSVKIVELPDDGGRPEPLMNEKNNDMKAWVTSTLGDSLKLINEKLEEVDKKAKMITGERAELEQLRLEKLKNEKESKESSTEKRKRIRVCTPVEHSPSSTRGKTRSRGSTKTRPKRIEILDDEGDAGVRKKFGTKMESLCELSDIKQMLAALLQGLNNPKE